MLVFVFFVSVCERERRGGSLLLCHLLPKRACFVFSGPIFKMSARQPTDYIDRFVVLLSSVLTGKC